MIRDYVVQTHPCSEAIAKANLEARGFGVYLPTVLYEGRTGRLREQRYTVMEPLFPGYLFVQLDLCADRWRRVASARGVRHLLGWDGEHPTPLPRGTLDELRERYAAGEFVHSTKAYNISAGDSVIVSQGAFQGHHGVCTVARGERIKVLLTVMGAAREVHMEVRTVRRAAE